MPLACWQVLKQHLEHSMHANYWSWQLSSCTHWPANLAHIDHSSCNSCPCNNSFTYFFPSVKAVACCVHKTKKGEHTKCKTQRRLICNQLPSLQSGYKSRQLADADNSPAAIIRYRACLLLTQLYKADLVVAIMCCHAGDPPNLLRRFKACQWLSWVPVT